MPSPAANKGFYPELLGPSLEHGPWRYSRIRKGKILIVPMVTTVYGFIDETGDSTADDKIWMCGYATTADDWQAFSDDWQPKVAVAGPIHGTELLSRKGMFFGWDDAKADDFLRELLTIIRTRIPLGILVGLDTKHYRSFTVPQRNQLGSPFLICMARVIDVFFGIVDELRKRYPEIAGINLAFDDSHRSADMLRTWLRLKKQRPNLTDLIKAVSFADDRWFYPLQAADLLANLTNRYWQPDIVSKARTRERAEGFLRELMKKDENFPFAYRVGFVSASEMDEAVRLHKRLY